jgi:predicted Fe-Mo cluster-binding NifX family protein
MKLLIASDGKDLKSTISKRFGHAAYFLKVDTDSKEIVVIENSPFTRRHEVIPAMAKEGVDTIIAAHIGPHAFALLAANGMRAVLARHVTVGEAIEKCVRGELKILDGPTLQHSIEEHAVLRIAQRHQRGRGPFRGELGEKVQLSTPRGRHHLQQFSGRGH